ncbi:MULTISPECIES: hypothetical protein [Actinosynnema]|uniref:hypothetical protein n=1 Tax=Actinosynnema TaxID=40566 RepID=UPI0020A49E9D|nr:hypothetical protein [Actinosynnema pretiosum]MCP2096234.1 hypothetical protein [Actinosynnema pretiosum]
MANRAGAAVAALGLAVTLEFLGPLATSLRRVDLLALVDPLMLVVARPGVVGRHRGDRSGRRGGPRRASGKALWW